ncbi:DUF4367 domain-containing protein [Clostridium sp.]|uniref:DUF4367 domain-containing protein n=1 Tax=Clostridium sp. TaxID=1506 RepID=UPI002FC58BAA
MDNQKNFKSLADDIMKDIKVSEELKERTLIKCRESKSKRFIKTPLVPATCFGVVLLLIFIWGRSVKPWNTNDEIGKNNIENANVMLAPDNSTTEAHEGGEEIILPGPIVSSDIKTLDEAKKYLEVNVLEPAYLPNGFKLKEIHGVSNNDTETRNLWIEYFAQDKILVISVEGNTMWKSTEEYRIVDINGIKGYIKSFRNNLNESAELRWFIGERLYTIEGTISEEEAIKVARSLK